MAPCCWYDQKIVVGPDIIQQHHDSFDSIQNWTPACRKCRTLELSGQQSLRLTGPDWISDQVPSQSAVMIDINLDTECNAACVMCDERSSSLWAREKNKMAGGHQKIVRTTQDVDSWIRAIVDYVPMDHVTYVKFFGGEPLVTDTHIKFLEKIPHPQNTTVHYTTNASILPAARVEKIWSRFRNIIYAASLDGTDRQFDYVRWPLSWQKVANNLIDLRQQRIPNLMFRVEFTANLLNIFYYDRLIDWVDRNLSTNAFSDPTEINIHHCFGTPFDLIHMPQNLRDFVRQKYPVDHVLHRSLTATAVNPDLRGFHAFADKWDAHRALAWQDCFPELVPYLSNK